MQKLIEGIHQFQETIFDTDKHLFERLAQGQQPLALFITCSDSRIDPSLLTQTQPGELFIMRNAGNIVPAYGAVAGGEAATIEYAVTALKVKDIIICGHSLCGAMDGLLHPDHLDGLNSVKAWLTHAHATARIIEENYCHIENDQDRLAATIKENVLAQIESLQTHPTVAAAVSRGDLKLHGWIYEFETGKVLCYHATEQQFVPIQHANWIPKPALLRTPAI